MSRATITAELRARAERWLARDPDPDTRAELAELLEHGAAEEVRDRFAGRLEFGTAGLRAELGAGPRRMNRLVVQQSATGLVRHLVRTLGRPPLVVIGFDARHKSDVFAADTAAVVAAAGGQAVVFGTAGPTPLLAFAVRHLAADAGVMVTASHNPPHDNGYKVYLGDGAQLVPPADAEIAAAIAQVAGEEADEEAELPGHGSPAAVPIGLLPDKVVDAYVELVVGQAVQPDRREVSVVYTPLHGVGGALALRAFATAGFPTPAVVTEQFEPDPDFATVGFPNPEEPGAMDLALAQAEQSGADVVLANDPDADRLGAAVPDVGGWRRLNGNEIGALLADHLLRHGPGGSGRLVVTTVVSSRLLRRLAARHGVRYAETLTGFKWIVRPAIAHPELRFIFGYEEALGYSVGPVVRDKDGIAGAVVFAEAVATLRAEGTTPAARLAALAAEVGLHATEGWSLRFPSRGEGAEAAAKAMAELRADPPGRVGGLAVVGREDLLDAATERAPSDTLVWQLEGGGSVVVRPSGTEPKLKVYTEVVVPPEQVRRAGHQVAAGQASTALAALRADLESRLAGV